MWEKTLQFIGFYHNVAKTSMIFVFHKNKSSFHVFIGMVLFVLGIVSFEQCTLPQWGVICSGIVVSGMLLSGIKRCGAF